MKKVLTMALLAASLLSLGGCCWPGGPCGWGGPHGGGGGGGGGGPGGPGMFQQGR